MELLKRHPTTFALSTGIIALLGFALSCSTRGDKEVRPEQKGERAKPANIKKPPSSYNDTLRITGKCAVFYSPDLLQMDKILQVNNKEVFAMLTHDCHYQMEYSRGVLKKYWPDVRIVETSGARYLLFEKADKSRLYIDLNEKNDICGVFLFDGKKDPVLADMPNIDTGLGFYFKHQ